MIKTVFTTYIISLFIIFSVNSPAKASKCNGCNGCPSQGSIAVSMGGAEDEFEPPSGSPGEFSAVADSGEFSPAAESTEFIDTNYFDSGDSEGINWKMLYWPLGAVGFTILAGIFLRFRPTRLLKTVFLVASAVFLGFYNGACPCPISSMSFAIIGVTGGDIYWESTIWFLALIPVTYILGQVWCGWVCHLGALQEFVFRRSKLKFLQGERAQKIMKIMRWLFLAALIIQLLYTRTYIFDDIDPFRIAFNLGYGADTAGWILLGLLLLASVFIYRPFCRAACPIGLVYGWIAKIPGASVLGKDDS